MCPIAARRRHWRMRSAGRSRRSWKACRSPCRICAPAGCGRSGPREATRDAALPDVPTFAEAGYPAAQSTNWFGFSAAAGIPPEITARWGTVIAEALADAKLRERFATIGVVPGRMDAAGYTALIAGELARWREVIRTAGIKPD